jgi:hypothetical protein
MTKPLFKSTIVIWSDYDPSNTELADLARDATDGDSYCSRAGAVKVDDPSTDPEWDGTEFFAARFDCTAVCNCGVADLLPNEHVSTCPLACSSRGSERIRPITPRSRLLD